MTTDPNWSRVGSPRWPGSPSSSVGWGWAELSPTHPWESKSAAVVLAFFLGDFGAHNFYLSQPVRAVAHLLLLGLGIVLIVQGNAVSRELTHTAGIPAGADWYLGGLGIIAANGLWRFVEFIILLSTPEHRFAR